MASALKCYGKRFRFFLFQSCSSRNPFSCGGTVQSRSTPESGGRDMAPILQDACGSQSLGTGGNGTPWRFQRQEFVVFYDMTELTVWDTLAFQHNTLIQNNSLSNTVHSRRSANKIA